MSVPSIVSIKHPGFAVLTLFCVMVPWRSYSDEPAYTAGADRISIATLDVDKVFKKSQKLNAAMAAIKAKLDRYEGYNTRFPDNHPLVIESTRVYVETYQRLREIVTRICKAKNIGLVIGAKLDSIDMADRVSVLGRVNRLVVYTDVPDLTDEVIAELDR